MKMNYMKTNYSPLLNDAIEEKNYANYFHFDLFADNVYENVINECKISKQARENLVMHLLEYNTSLRCSEATFLNIQALKDENTYTVIAGQQAGFLLGPLYTIHKIVSLLSYTKDIEKKTGKKMVPVFWIAGEDHDFDEVNHLYFKNKGQLNKWVHPQKESVKKPLSHIDFNEKDEDIIKKVFQNVEETEYTKELYAFLQGEYKLSTGWSDFFARIVLQLFKDEGLVVVDAHHPKMRELEKQHFIQLVKKTSEIQHGLKKTQNVLNKKGYNQLISMDDDCAHLFYVTEYGRHQLYFDKESKVYYTKNGHAKMSKEELLIEIETNSSAFSNNVVTRPIMQQMMFPAVAFVSGAGEFGYWAELKGVFENLEMKMPIVLLRHSFTYVERNVLSRLTTMNISLDEISVAKIREEQGKYWENKHLEEGKEQLDELQDVVMNQLNEKLEEINAVFFQNKLFNKKLSENVADAIKVQVTKEYNRFLKREEEGSKMYTKVLLSLFPKDAYQERTYNMLYFLNKYGFEWLEKLKNVNLGQKDEHYIILL